MKIRPAKRTLAVIALSILVMGLFMVRDLRPVAADSDLTYEKLKLLTDVLETIQSKYVDKPDPDKLIDGAIKGMVASLDPHSSYMGPEEFKELRIETSGKFSGIGIEITIRDDFLTVVSPIEGTPAYQAGLKAGDRIIKVDGKLTKQMTLMDAVKVIRGPKGSPVELTILRKGEGKLLDFSIVRDVIPLISVKSRILAPGFGYLRVTNFQSRTVNESLKALSDLEAMEGGLKGLVLDLRNNPGGLLNSAVDFCDIWLDKGLIVYTEGRVKAQNMKFRASPGGAERDYPIVVLVNNGSASASEIVAGALKDHGRAVIMGQRTFGKGSVQTIIPFGGNAGLRLTTARYYTPAGVSIQAKGIEPDVDVELLPPPEDNGDKPAKAFREQDLQGHIAGEGEEPTGTKEEQAAARVNEEEQTTRRMLRMDNQLREALGLLKAWEVFSARTRQAD